MDWENALGAPFDPADVDFKPQTMSKDGTKALAIAFVDPRRYQERLSAVLGAGNWSIEYRPLGDKALIAKLTLNTPDGTVVREDVGEFDEKGLAQYPTASAQAFKRACVTLGLGRYLYELPHTWVAVENRRITDSEITRLRNQLPKPAKAKPAAPTVDQKHASAIKRIGELVTKLEAEGKAHDLPKGWQSLPYEQLVVIGTALAKL